MEIEPRLVTSAVITAVITARVPLVLSAAENLFLNARSQDPNRPDPVVVFAELRTRTDAWVQARDDADAYQREHGQ